VVRPGKPGMKMSGRLEIEVSVSISLEIQAALDAALEFNGLRSSQYVRLALVERLHKDGWIERKQVVQPVKLNAEDKPIIPAAVI